MSKTYTTTCANGEQVIIYPDQIIHPGHQGNIVAGKLIATQQPIAIKLSHPLAKGYSLALGVDTKSDLLHEANTLHCLLGVTGVPKYYGVTRLPINDEQEYIAIILEQINGIDLAQWRKQHQQQRLLISDALELLKRAAIIFEQVHARGVVHCDIKASNLMLNQQRELYIVDWGAAQRPILNTALNKPFRKPALITGTMQFISFEHVTGEPVDARADIYSLGALIATLTYGHLISARYEIGQDGKERERTSKEIAQAVASGETLKYYLFPQPKNNQEMILQQAIKIMTQVDKTKRFASMSHLKNYLTNVK
ncbi:MAG: protein kinase [Patescibacteria group bacterium]|jgi:serine/threonine protein kinase